MESNGLEDIKKEELPDGDIELSGNNYTILAFSQGVIIDNKQYKKFITSVERTIRTSSDYKKYLEFLRSEVGLINCSVFGNVNATMASIEFHHYPFSLYQIVELVIEKLLSEKTPINTFIVADKVLELHFSNLIGLVPLSETIHELVHSGEIFIDLRQVYGDIKKFVEIYNEFITEEDFDKLKILYESSLANTPESLDDILAINTDGKFNPTINEKWLKDFNILLGNEIPRQDY